MKFIAAILVVMIHTSPLTSISSALNFGLENGIARIAVPFFFVASGYFFYIKIGYNSNENNKRADRYLIKYLKRITAMYLIWSSLYVVVDLHASYLAHPSIVLCVVYYLRDLIFLGGHYHLWYFPALLFATGILYLASRKLSLKVILMMAVGLYVIGLLGDSYYGLIKQNEFLSGLWQPYFNLFITTRNGLFFGFIYVTIGAFLSERGLLRPNLSGIGLGLSLIGLVVEVYLLQKFTEPRFYNMMLLQLPAAYFLFQFLIQVKVPSWSINYKLLRDCSILIYCSHAMFITLYPKLLPYLHIDYFTLHSLTRFLLILLSSFLCSIVIIRVRRYEKTSKFVSLTY